MNHVVGNGPEIEVETLNAWIGAINGSGNANIIAKGGLATNIQALNFETGIGNGSGNANVIVGEGGCTPGLQEDLKAAGDDPKATAGVLHDHCKDATNATNIAVLNNYSGLFNGALNGNNIGSGSAFVVEAENTASGIGNFSGNGNSVGQCHLYTQENPPPGNLDSDTQTQTQVPLDGDQTGLLRCNKTGDSTAIIANNRGFGNLNGSGNGNALGGLNGLAPNGDPNATAGKATVIMTDNTLFGNLNAAGNGNAFGSGQDGYAEIRNNFISGNKSGTNNGNGYSGNAVITNNRVMGDGSLSDNGNATDPASNGDVTLNNITVLGNNSFSHNATGTYQNDVVLGDGSADNNQDGFNNNFIIGHGSGGNAGTNVTNNYVFGNGAGVGYGNNATNNIAMGTGAGNGVNANNTVSIGTNALAAGESGVAIGNLAYAAGPNDTALGAGATVTADHSTALGAGAKATLPNQFVMGTKSDTYKAPGVTSSLSRSRQSGPLEVVTSDANGNLATDGGQIFNKLDNLSRRTNENSAGVALALAAVNPDLTGNESFGMSANWGNFDGSNAFGMGFEGVIGHDWLSRGDRVAITGGFGVGFVDGGGNDVWGGRLGGQWTWGGAPH